MTEEQVRRIFKVLEAEYGNKVRYSIERYKVWQMVLHHAAYEEVQAAVVRLIGEARQFPPSVGEVNQAVLQARGGTQTDWGTLWDKVMVASQRSTYYAEEEAKKLPATALAAIGGIAGLKELAAAKVDDVATIRAQFRQRLEAKSTAAQTNANSHNVQTLINSVKLKGIENVPEEK